MALALIVGAGVIGLAAARALARAGHEVVVADAASAIGTGISARNSEVVHAGLYYPTGSLRQRHCVEGRRLLYAHCRERGIAHRRTGKLVVATDPAEIPRIEAIHALGTANGVEGLGLIDGAEARRLEPALACAAALLSPETGIVDAHGLMLSLLGEVEDAGGAFAANTSVTRLERAGGRWRVHFAGADPGTIDADLVVNAAGLGAQALAGATHGLDPLLVPPLVPVKGSYFTYAGRAAFTRLIYPAPVDGGLGIHVTLDLAGRMRFGPDVEWPDGGTLPGTTMPDYGVDPARAALFAAGIRRYWPGLDADRLHPDYAGIRPKLTGKGRAPADFMIQGPAEHGLSGLVNLFGIESPGLTACLSLAQAVVAALRT
ncbi:FAD-dependent oxidoreductase [Zavarzinia compransoris]|uniref:NAD(P)/FAD-dependent oxidoreductase n=1 Tax=Zavarzinia marina TaxID=2911065 RepID=UPI001F367113|nr:FAD-dependent oxidoreductase [Zavarzinia marina]MCF4166506.1 FAD-dependent oxidoreductase [Zavarzinia marina]